MPDRGSTFPELESLYRGAFSSASVPTDQLGVQAPDQTGQCPCCGSSLPLQRLASGAEPSASVPVHGSSRSVKRLEIGSRRRRAGWVTLDTADGADIRASVPPLPDEVIRETWQTVQMIHCFEHLYLWDARQLLHEIRDILDRDGELILELPNLQYAIDVMSGKVAPPADHPRFSMWPLYGDPSHRDPSFGHRWGYTPQTMEKELRDAGFRRIRHERAKSHYPVRDMRVVAGI